MKFAMEDARVYTDWRPSCTVNYELQKKYNVENNSHEYRYYLQRNAKKIIKDLQAQPGECILCPVCQNAVKYRPNQ